MILGSDHPDTLMSMSNLAVLYDNQDKFNEAEPLYKECLSKCETILGSDHPNTLITIYGLAKSYVDQGKYHEAKPLYNLHLKNCVNELGPDHLLTITIRENLDNIHSLQ